MNVGIPKEISPTESRVGATPKTVERLRKQGFEVNIQTGAGAEANFSDQQYKAAGANIGRTGDAQLSQPRTKSRLASKTRR